MIPSKEGVQEGYPCCYWLVQRENGRK